MDVARFSPTDYLTMLERFVTNGDVFEFETNVQMDFPRAINYDPILLYLQRLMKDPLIQSRVLGSRLARSSSTRWPSANRRRWRR
jgi:hypothetical protein